MENIYDLSIYVPKRVCRFLRRQIASSQNAPLGWKL